MESLQTHTPNTEHSNYGDDENSNPNVPILSPTKHVPQRKSTYHLHVDIMSEYKLVTKRNKRSSISETEKSERRRNGEHHLDLWTDGSIYPKDPFSNAPPPFQNVTNLLHFVGDGKQGLLGYAQHLELQGTHACHQRDFLLMENITLKKQALSSTKTIGELEKKVESLRQKETALGPRQRKRKLNNIEAMAIGGGALKKRIQAAK